MTHKREGPEVAYGCVKYSNDKSSLLLVVHSDNSGKGQIQCEAKESRETG